MNHKKELLRGLWVQPVAAEGPLRRCLPRALTGHRSGVGERLLCSFRCFLRLLGLWSLQKFRTGFSQGLGV